MATETTTYTGRVESHRTAGTYATAYQRMTSKDKFSASVKWACFTKTPFLKAVGVEAFGVASMNDIQMFGQARPSGRIVQIDSGVYKLSGLVFASVPTSFHVGRLGSFNPELVEGGDEYAYSWHRLAVAEFIPDVDVQDNTKGLVNIKGQKMQGMKQQYVKDFNYCLLGNTSAPDASTLAPSAVYSDMPNLISVTQTRTVGGIATTNAYWQNGIKAIATIGGGGEMDRPLVLRRSILDAKNDQLQHAEASDDYMGLASQGAWQYLDRLQYADSVQAGRGGAFGTLRRYDLAGIPNYALDGTGVVWDPAVTVPYGATGSTESITFIHIPSYGISLRGEENFKASDWEKPREHDLLKTLVASIKTRYTPFVSQRRPHFVCYNMPACPD